MFFFSVFLFQMLVQIASAQTTMEDTKRKMIKSVTENAKAITVNSAVQPGETVFTSKCFIESLGKLVIYFIIHLIVISFF